MRRRVVRATTAIRLFAALLLTALLFAACGSSSPKASTAGSTSASSPVGTSTTEPVVVPSSPTTPVPETTTTVCPGGGSTAPVTTPASTASALLLTISANTTACTDRLVFSFTVKGGTGPRCNVAYKPGPFTQDASGAPVKVAGTEFVVVRCSPAYGYDFNTGKTTYTGSKRIDLNGSHYVRELVETGDFEGVVTWVVGLVAKRPFDAKVTTIPPGLSTLFVTFS